MTKKEIITSIQNLITAKRNKNNGISSNQIRTILITFFKGIEETNFTWEIKQHFSKKYSV